MSYRARAENLFLLFLLKNKVNKKMKPLNSSRLCFGAVLLSVIILMQAVPPVLCRHHVNCQVCSCRDDYIICTKEHSIISTLTTAAASSDVAVAVVAESYYANVSSLLVFLFLINPFLIIYFLY